MILVDKDIKARASEIFEKGYDENNVKPVSYDVHIKGIIEDDGTVESYRLRPNEVVFIESEEMIKMPLDLMGRIGEKNSRMRQGLHVAGPHYFPGHKTRLFLRVQNISSAEIRIKKGDSIAQIFFEQLTDIPEHPYNNQQDAAFNDEEHYRGLAKYKDEYEERMNQIKDANKNLDDKINRVYANILTIMGLFVSVFSLIMVNFTNITNDHMGKEFLIPMNISLGIVISLFMGLILFFLNHAHNKWFLGLYLLLIVVLIILLCILF